MEKHKAIPKGYMTVGALAKKMNVTVRTLQHYDKEGFFSPSAESEGGRRLYTDKDLITLYQILSLKHLGFSLQDIKTKLIPLESPADVASILAQQSADLAKKIESLSEAQEEIERLKAEVMQMQSVDFKKYAAIIVNLQMKNEFYWLIKHFDEHTLNHAHTRFTKESGEAFFQQFKQLWDEIKQLQQQSVPPESEAAQQLAKSFWDMVREFTAGDASMLPSLMQVRNNMTEHDAEQALVTNYVEKALEAYFITAGVDPFAEEAK